MHKQVAAPGPVKNPGRAVRGDTRQLGLLLGYWVFGQEMATQKLCTMGTNVLFTIAVLALALSPNAEGIRLTGRSFAAGRKLIEGEDGVIIVEALPLGAPKPVFNFSGMDPDSVAVLQAVARPVASPDDTRVINGESVEDMFRFGYVVRLESAKTPEGNIFLCGGTLIAEDIVLTAGHCDGMK